MAIILAGFMADRGLTDELVIKMLRGACGYAISHNWSSRYMCFPPNSRRRKATSSSART